MKPANQNSKSKIRTRIPVLSFTLATIIATVACSSKSKPVVQAAEAEGATVRPASLVVSSQPVNAGVSKGDLAKQEIAKLPVKRDVPKKITYKSRDYGVSFVYPWQYTHVSAKQLANGDESLKPKPDGDEGQFTLARVEIPKGYYPDTDFDNAYFTLSLNPNLGEEACDATLSSEEDAKLETASINGVDLRWIETDKGGDGSAMKTRNYVAFTNETCYEIEAGVKTVNEHGLARELDPDQVFRRLDAILATVKFASSGDKPASQQLQSAVTSTEAPEVK